jgi:competence protein ComEA
MSRAADMNKQGSFRESETFRQAALIAHDVRRSGENREVVTLRGRLRAAWTDGVWLPIVARSLAVVATMGALAALGATSTVDGSGVPLSHPEINPEQESMAGMWLASGAPSPDPPSGAHEAAAGASGTETPRGVESSERGAPVEPGKGGSGQPKETEGAPGTTPDGKVILNTATAADLTRLPHVGEKRAEAILRLREKLGRFKKPTELLRVRGIGVKTLKKMLPHLVVDAPAS